MSHLTPDERDALGLVPKRRGHWPRGRRRNRHDLPDDRVTRTLDRLRRAVEATPLQSDPTYAGAADYAGVESRTVRRWVAGDDWPPRAAVLRIEQYLSTTTTKTKRK